MMRGTDISAYQSSIPAGDFCVLKATEGLGYDDPPFASRWKALGQRGTLRGAYHFSHPKNDPVAEANHFLRIVRAAGLKPGDMLVLDHEVSDGTSPAHCAAWARTWCQYVTDSVGYRPVVYTFLSFAQEGRCEGLGTYPLWIADPSRAPAHPRVPAPWKSWVMHQYAETGGIDRDVFNGDRAGWLALGGGGDMPLNKDDIAAIYETDGIIDNPTANPKNPKVKASWLLTDTNRQVRNLAAMVAALSKQVPADGVDEQAIVQGVLAGLSPETIAAAVVAAMPADEAKRVVDELAARLAT